MPDVVLLDLGMPQMDGYAVAEALRQTPGLTQVYIAALTEWNDPKTRDRVAAAGFNWHLTKPAKVEVVLDLIEHVSLA